MTDTDTTGKSFIAFWSWAAEKGLINPNTAAGMRAAATKVLSVEENQEQVDIAKLDVDGILKRFENLKKRDFTPGSLETYKQRFRLCVKSYLEYINDPGGWRWVVRERTAAPDRAASGTKAKRRTGAPSPDKALDAADPQTTPLRGKTIDFQFPLREGVIVHLFLPADLRAAEVRRLNAFMTTLVVDAAADNG